MRKSMFIVYKNLIKWIIFLISKTYKRPSKRFVNSDAWVKRNGFTTFARGKKVAFLHAMNKKMTIFIKNS